MFKIKNLKLKVLILSIVCIFAFSSFAYADENQQTDVQSNETETTIVANDTVEGNAVSEEAPELKNIKYSDITEINDKIDIEAPVDGNAYLCGREVTVNSTINGNAFICAETVNLTKDSYICSSACICAKKITVEGYVYDLYAAGETVNVESTGYVVRDLHVGARDFKLTGFVRRNADVDCKTINVDGSSTRVAGDLNYISSNELSLNDKAVIGKVTYHKAEEAVKSSTPVQDYVRSLVMTLVYALVVILVIVLAMKKFTDKTEKAITAKFGPTLGYGFLGLVAIPVICFILMFTIIGIIPSILLFVAYLFVLSISKAIVAVGLGKYICKKMNQTSNAMVVLFSALVVVAIWVLKEIPFVGFFVSLIVNCLGLGVVLTTLLKASKKDKKVKKADVEVKAEKSEAKKETKKVEEKKETKSDKKDENK